MNDEFLNRTPDTPAAPTESPAVPSDAPAAPPEPQPVSPYRPSESFPTSSVPPFYAVPEEPKKPKKKKGGIVLLVVLLSVLYLALMGGVVTLIVTGVLQYQQNEVEEEALAPLQKTDRTPIAETPSTEEGGKTIISPDYTGEALSPAELYERVVPAVVFVRSNYSNGYSTGSGFVIDSENGYILTNCHVVKDSNDIEVVFSNGDSYTAELVGGDEINDVAVLRIAAENLQHVTIGSSEDVRIGDDVIVVGNPLGDLTFTMTRGIVSGKERMINTGEYTINTFQTDAAINSGNSGGPAFDSTGAVIGIASAKYAASGVEGIGFCIPIEEAMVIARDLVEYGYVTGRPLFGITVSDSPGYIVSTDEYGRRVRIEVPYGAFVELVSDNSAASRAGLKKGDIIVKMDGVEIAGGTDLINKKNRYHAGDTVTLEVYRGKSTIALEITFGEYVPEE